MHTLLTERARSARSSVIRDLLRLVDRPGVLSLAGGLPAADCFPVQRIAVAADEVLAGAGPLGCEALQYGPTEGDGSLREVLATRTGSAVGCTVVTAGSQQGLDLLTRVLVEPGDVVVVEQPGYVGAIQAFRAAGPRLVGVPVDADGLCTEVLAAQLREGLRPKLVYTVPNFQNPTGVTLAVRRRRQLGELSDRYGFVVIEDDPYGELRFGSPAPPGVGEFGARVVRLGSASKILAPGLRVGWMTAPADLVDPVVRLKQAADLHTSSLAQRIVALLLADGPFLAGHLERLRLTYAERASALRAALPAALASEPARGGLFLWADASGVDTAALLSIALEHGVAFVPGSAFAVDDRVRSTMRLSFASLPATELVEAGSRLSAAFAAYEGNG